MRLLLLHVFVVGAVAGSALLSGAEAQPALAFDSATYLERRGGSLRIGHFGARGAWERPVTTRPFIEAAFSHGLQRRATVETSIALWSRVDEYSWSDGMYHEQRWILPLFHTLTLYPWTEREDWIEPYFEAGPGVVLSWISPGSGPGSVARMRGVKPGIGLRAGGGVDLRLSPSLALTVGTRWQVSRNLTLFEPDHFLYGNITDVGLRYRLNP